MRRAAQKWLKQARHDLHMAEKNISIAGYDVACFLAHQAVEKLLKAVIIAEGKKPPRSHYLDELGKVLALPVDVSDALNELSGDYMMSRYPDVGDAVPFEEYDRETAMEKVAIAKAVFAQLQGRCKGLEADHE